MTIKSILSFNFHGSALEWSVFTSSADRKLYQGYIDYSESAESSQDKNFEDEKWGDLVATKFYVKNISTSDSESEDLNKLSQGESLDKVMSWVEGNDQIDVIAIGHRVINAGIEQGAPQIMDRNLIERLQKLPSIGDKERIKQVSIAEYIQITYPDYVQIACFDGGFYRKMNDVYGSFPLPEKLVNQGVKPQGLHGLACEQILNKMSYVTDIADRNIIIANLDKNYSSVCSVMCKQPVSATRSFSSMDALMGLNNAGNIGSGAVLYMMKYGQYSVEQIYDILFSQSGISAITGMDLSKDLSLLEYNLDENVQLAVEMFSSAIASEISALIPSLRGEVDAIIFSSYIGENSPLIRKKICEKLSWFGVDINDAANMNDFQTISKKTSKVRVLTLAANPCEMVAIHSSRTLVESGHMVPSYA